MRFRFPPLRGLAAGVCIRCASLCPKFERDKGRLLVVLCPPVVVVAVWALTVGARAAFEPEAAEA